MENHRAVVGLFLVVAWALSACTDLKPLPPPATGVAPSAAREQPTEQSRVIQGMQKQLRERDRQIAILRSQLEALKYIDQEHTEKQRKVKPPASLRMTDRYPEPSQP